MDSYGPPRLRGKINLKHQYNPSLAPLGSPRKGSYTLNGGKRDLPRERPTNSPRHNLLSSLSKGSYTLSGGHKNLPRETIRNSPRNKRPDNKLDTELLPNLTEKTHFFSQKLSATSLENTLAPFDYQNRIDEEQQHFHNENQENIPPSDYQPPRGRCSLFDYRVKIGARERKVFGEIDISELREVDERGLIINPDKEEKKDVLERTDFTSQVSDTSKDDCDVEAVHIRKKLALSPLNADEPFEQHDMKRRPQIHILSTLPSNMTQDNRNDCHQDGILSSSSSPICENRESKVHLTREDTASVIWEDPSIASSEEISDQNEEEKSDENYSYDEYDELSSFDNGYNDLYDSPFLRRLRASIFDNDEESECDTSFATTVSDITVLAKSVPKHDASKSTVNPLSPVAVKSIFWTGGD